MEAVRSGAVLIRSFFLRTEKPNPVLLDHQLAAEITKGHQAVVGLVVDTVEPLLQVADAKSLSIMSVFHNPLLYLLNAMSKVNFLYL